MIRNYIDPAGIFSKLNASPYEFYPTGSRFFNTYHNDSDFDYFATYSSALVFHLEDMGFRRISTSDYKDTFTIKTMRYISAGIQVDIQLVSNANVKSQIQEVFKKNSITHPSTEQWNTAILFHSMSTVAPKSYNVSDIVDQHKFDNMIPAIKYLREHYVRKQDGLLPGLVDTKRFIESIMVMALTKGRS